jgi:hypothetical protein
MRGAHESVPGAHEAVVRAAVAAVLDRPLQHRQLRKSIVGPWGSARGAVKSETSILDRLLATGANFLLSIVIVKTETTR